MKAYERLLKYVVVRTPSDDMGVIGYVKLKAVVRYQEWNKDDFKTTVPACVFS